jgi:mono/diheme cytochrome c family protein
MKKYFVISAALFLHFMRLPIQAQKSGEELFKSTCAACHTINKGRLVGPDLTGVYDKRDHDWLIQFIRSSQQMIRDGDTAALKLYEANNRIPMPDNKLNDQEIASILAYIRESDDKGSVSQQPSLPKDSTVMEYSAESVSTGRALFNGYASFTNGASPCMACHHINDQLILGGGRLSLDLTGVYTKLGAAGISAIIGNPPFPVMQRALLNHPISEDEIHAVTAMLKTVDLQSSLYQTRDSGGFAFLIIASVCGLMILVHIYLLYDSRKIP